MKHETFHQKLKNRNPRRRSGGVLPKREEPTQFCENYIFASQKFRKIAGFMYSPPLRASLRSALRFGLAFNPAHGGAGFSAREYKMDEFVHLVYRLTKSFPDEELYGEMVTKLFRSEVLDFQRRGEEDKQNGFHRSCATVKDILRCLRKL